MEDIVDRLLHGTVIAIYPDGSKLPIGPSNLDREAAEHIKQLRDALRPFAEVAKHNIGDDESDDDVFRPMRSQYAVAPVISVGALRRALAILQSDN